MGCGMSSISPMAYERLKKGKRVMECEGAQN